MFNTLRDESGTALAIALSILAMLSIIGIMSVKTSNIDMELSNFQANNDKAFYAADAGAKRAILEVIDNPDWNTGYTNYPIDKAFYTVGIENGSSNPALHDTIIITSTGLKEGGRATIEVTMATEEVFNPVEYSMFARNNIDIQSNMKTDSYNSDSGSYLETKESIGGDIGANGDITIKNNAIIGGETTTATEGALKIFDESSVLGTATDTAPVGDVPSIPMLDFMEAYNDNSADKSGTIMGDYIFNPSIVSFRSSGVSIFNTGTYYFSDFIIDNAASIIIPPGEKVEIYVFGAVIIKNSGTINADGKPENLKMYIQSSFELNNSAIMKGIIYAPDASIVLNNSADYYGSIVANDILCHSSSTFHFDRSLKTMGSGASSEYKLVAWREL